MILATIADKPAARAAAYKAASTAAKQRRAPNKDERAVLAEARQVLNGDSSHADAPTPEELRKNLADRLDESAEFMARYAWATPAQFDAMTLIAAMSHVTDAFITMPRAIWLPGGEQQENVGKTEAMLLVTRLGYNSLDLAGGTWPEVRSMIFEAANSGLRCPLLFRDEISDVFGLSGVNYQNHPVGDIAKRGYKRGAMVGRSTSRSSERASIFAPMLFTGRKVAVPKDIRTRCIVFEMFPSPHPVEYFDERDAADEAARLNDSLAHAVLGLHDSIRSFRVRKLRRPGLSNRRAEVWEPLFAVANAAGQEWLNRCMAAFAEIAMTEADQPVLSPKQMIIRDVAAAAVAVADEGTAHQGRVFLAGSLVRDEMMKRKPALYGELDPATLGRRIADAVPRDARASVTADEVTTRGYYAEALVAAWEAIAPRELADVAVHEDEDPFAPVSGADDWAA